MVQWPTPSCTKGLRGFLGLAWFYRKFVRGYATIAQPLTDLLKGNFTWSSTTQQAFDTLKYAMTNTTVLSLPDFSKTFYVKIDAFGSTMDAILTQDNHLITYFSKVFCPRLSKSSAYVPELHAIKSAYKQGKLNKVVDALSQPDCLTKGKMHLLTIPQFVFLRDLKESKLLDPDFILMRDKYLSDPSSYPYFNWNDFVIGLPPSNGYTMLLVVVDRFSKAVHLGTIHSDFTAYKVAELFVTLVCKHHGLLKSIVSGRDLIFISRFWSDLFKFSDTLLRMSSSYHSQTDGQTKVMNHTIEQYLRAFVHNKPNHWFKYLPWVEYHYNNAIHSGFRLTLFEVVYGKPPSSIPTYIEDTSSNAVFGHKYHKLAKRFCGPYKVLERIGPIAYKIELSPQSKIHNVFHCSMLKCHEGAVPPSIDHLPPEFVENSPLVTSLLVLDFKTIPMDGVPTRFALVQWNELSPDDTSWEK
ncbi:uncharacterized protein LOC106766231 [Vigna radiata var. radiata]|uniref:Uncharacterized protein LOC106766231 n=1 Tax=Vigna radiata var. radiata TaxID=3916 RepID=A0A1S3UK99_VIGRR|nr:uncharacterized protein LOC106766231 [Vigna radiata var. radiata]